MSRSIEFEGRDPQFSVEDILDEATEVRVNFENMAVSLWMIDVDTWELQKREESLFFEWPLHTNMVEGAVVVHVHSWYNTAFP